MIILDVEQGTQPWADARCGILTASQMGRVVTSGGEPVMPKYYAANNVEPPSSRAPKQCEIFAQLKAYPLGMTIEPSSALTALLRSGRIREIDPPPDAQPVRKPCEPSAQAEDYLWQLVAESLLGQPLDDEWAGSYWTERGHALEPQARAWLALHADLEVKSVGLIYRDERRDVACSPDGLAEYLPNAPSFAEGVELKCPMLKTHLRWLAEYRRTGEMPAEHRMQVQGSLWITGLPRWHFVAYHPPLEDGRSLPQLHVAVEPEPAVQAALDEHVPAFLERLQEAKESLG